MIENKSGVKFVESQTRITKELYSLIVVKSYWESLNLILIKRISIQCCKSLYPLYCRICNTQVPTNKRGIFAQQTH